MLFLLHQPNQVLILKLDIKRIRIDRGYSQRELAERCGWEQARISHYETGRSKPNADDLLAMARGLQVPVGELFMQSESSDDVVVRHKRMTDTKFAPLISEDEIDAFLAGDLDLSNHATYAALGLNPRQFFYIVKGDAMLSTGKNIIPDNYVVEITPTSKAPGDGVHVMAKVENQNFVIRQYKIDGGKGYLRPLNDAFEIITSDFEIVGIVLWSSKLFKVD